MKAGFVTSQIRSHLKEIQCYELKFSALNPAFIKHSNVICHFRRHPTTNKPNDKNNHFDKDITT